MNRHDRESQQGRRRFHIWVAGRLGAGFPEGFNGIEQQEDAGGNTRLSGDLVDQSQIHGILDRLWRLGVEVLRFETCHSDDQMPSIGAEPPEPSEAPRVETEAEGES